MDSVMEQLEAPADVPQPQTPAQNLMALVKHLIEEQQFEGVALLFTSETEAPRNLNCLAEVGMELYHDVCVPNLNDVNHETRWPLYTCAEELLLVIAAHAPMEELLLELLEMVEEQKSEFVFTSALRALQVVLLRMGDRKPHALEWTLNSIHTHLQELPVPDYLSEGYDRKQERLLEQNAQIERLLMHYITVGLFYEPLLQVIVQEPRKAELVFRNCGMIRRNVLCCFLIQLLGKPLALLHLSLDEQRTNSYTVQCARNLTENATRCIGDPLYFLPLAEQRVRWRHWLDASKNVHERSANNIFLNEEKLPLEALAIYLYMVLVEEVCQLVVPKVYAPLYVFEKGIYYVNELLTHTEPPLVFRALLLMKRLLENLKKSPIPAVSLELSVHKDFCLALCNVIGYSSLTHVRQASVQLLRQYIMQFDDEGKHVVLTNLLRSITHVGISGFLAVLYKDLVANALISHTATLPSSFSGNDFRTIFLRHICYLPNGAETDLIEHSDKVISSLNALRFFALKDYLNRTGLWDFMADIQAQFLEPLREGLNLSVAHYKVELQRVEKGLDGKDAANACEQLKMLDINIANATSEMSKIDMEVSRQRKIEILNQNLCTFDLMRSLLARANECVESSGKFCKNAEVQV